LACPPRPGGHVQNQTGKGTGTCAVCTFFTGSGEERLGGVVDQICNRVLRDLLCGFSRAFNTTTDQRRGHHVLDEPEVRSNQVKQTNWCTQLGSQTTLFFRGTLGFSRLTGFACTCGYTNTCADTGSGATTQSKEREGGTQGLTEFASYALFVSGSRSQGLTGGLGQLTHLTPHRLFLGFGQQRRKARSSSLTKADCTGGQTLEEFFDVATKGSLRRRGRRRCYRTP
jgi:hypothetical protein